MSETQQEGSQPRPEAISGKQGSGGISAPPASRYPFTPYPNGWFRAAYSAGLAPGEILPLGVSGRARLLYPTGSGLARRLDPACPQTGRTAAGGGRGACG